jgi:hypothetical protein
MGYLLDGRSAEQISIRQDVLSAAIYTPSTLIYSPPGKSTAVDVVRDGNGSLRQIKAPQAFADVVTISSAEYEIRILMTVCAIAAFCSYSFMWDESIEICHKGGPYRTWRILVKNPQLWTSVLIEEY